MKDLPTVEQLQATYRPVSHFLEKLPAVIELGKSSQDSSEMWDLAEAIEKEILTLLAPFDRLRQLRALASQRAEPRSVVDPENWTGALALESPWWGGIQHGKDQEGSRGGVQGQGCPGIGSR